MSNNIAVIGDSDFISGFKALEFVLYPVDDKSDLRSTFGEIIKLNFSCIFILESYASKIMDLIEEYSRSTWPSIVPLPDFREKIHLSENLLSRMTVKAIGRNII